MSTLLTGSYRFTGVDSILAWSPHLVHINKNKYILCMYIMYVYFRNDASFFLISLTSKTSSRLRWYFPFVVWNDTLTLVHVTAMVLRAWQVLIIHVSPHQPYPPDPHESSPFSRVALPEEAVIRYLVWVTTQRQHEWQGLGRKVWLSVFVVPPQLRLQLLAWGRT